MNRQYTWRWLALLMAVVCLPRLTIDLYLPSLPAMASELAATPAQVQRTLSDYMIGYACSMLLCGPLADRYGRRPVLLGGLALYVFATLICLFAPRIDYLMGARLLQALGGCCGTVVGRVIVKDRFPLAAQASLLAHLSSGMALTPVLAPMLGGLIETHAGWRADFLLMALLGAVLLWLIWRDVPETVTAQTRQQAKVPLARQYALLLRDRDFLRPTLTISLGYATYFAFISASSFLFQHDLQLGPLQYAGCFALSVLGYLLGAHLMRHMTGRLALDRLLGRACLLNLMASLLLWLCVWRWPASPWAIVLPMMLLMLSVGVLIPACQLAVMQVHPQRVGTASGLFFFVQMSCAALCSTLIGCLPGGGAVMAGVILSASLLTCLAWFALVPRGVRQQGTA